MSKALVLSLKNNKIHGDDEILLGGEWVLENQNIEKRKLNYKIFNSKSSLKEIRRKNCVEADKIYQELFIDLSKELNSLHSINLSLNSWKIIFGSWLKVFVSICYERNYLISEILDLIESNGPFDAILMNLHGAAVSEEFHDMDGEITKRVRDLIGPEVPFGINLDMHANVSEQMILNTDITNVYQTTPHLDADETGYKCAELIYKTVEKEIIPVQSIETPPMIINIVNTYYIEVSLKISIGVGL